VVSIDDEELPDGWNRYSDHEGRWYYANNDGVTQWEAPQGATSGSTANASSFSALGIDYESRESSTVHSHPRKEL